MMIGVNIAMVVAGLAMRAWARRANPCFSFLTQSPQQICTDGPYRYVRHPAYAGSLLLAFGLVSLVSGWRAAFAAVFVLWQFLVWLMLMEESFIGANFPEYAAYCTKVRWRVFPYVG